VVVRRLPPFGKEVRQHPLAHLTRPLEQDVPRVGEPAPGHRLLGWASAALAASRRQFEIDYEAARASMRAANHTARDEALERAERIYGYRRLRRTALIDEQEGWMRQKEAYGSEGGRAWNLFFLGFSNGRCR